jgi:predicted RNase H-like HicB family nuclease
MLAALTAPRSVRDDGQPYGKLTTYSRGDNMPNTYTAVIKEDGDWWIGWIEEVPGVNCQEHTHDQLLTSLRETLSEALQFNRQDALRAAVSNYAEELVTV